MEDAAEEVHAVPGCGRRNDLEERGPKVRMAGADGTGDMLEEARVLRHGESAFDGIGGIAIDPKAGESLIVFFRSFEEGVCGVDSTDFPDEIALPR